MSDKEPLVGKEIEKIVSFIEQKTREAEPHPGAVVTLKTGGPSMVVEMRNADRAHCIWHNNDGDIFKDWIPIICLKVKA